MSLIEAVHDYINTYEPLAHDRINVDFLPDDVGSYSLEITPCTAWLKRYVDGGGMKQFQFLLASREVFDESLREQMDHISFYEDFSAWLEEQCNSLLDLGEGRQAVKLEALSCGYAFSQTENTARYQIQCKLTYNQERI